MTLVIPANCLLRNVSAFVAAKPKALPCAVVRPRRRLEAVATAAATAAATAVAVRRLAPYKLNLLDPPALSAAMEPTSPTPRQPGSGSSTAAADNDGIS